MAPSSISAGSTACCISPIWRGAACSIRPKRVKVGDKVKVVVLKYDAAARTRLARHEANHARPVDQRVGGELSGRRALRRQSRQRHRLRRFRRTGKRRRGADPRLRDDLEQARGASVEGRQRGRHGRGAGARRRRGQSADLARAQADRAQSVAGAGAAASAGQHDQAARSSRSPTSACSSKSNRASTGWCISPICRGPRRCAILRRSTRRATRSRRSCWGSRSRHERVSLGVKQLTPDPWDSVAERYPLNTRDQRQSQLGRGLRRIRRAGGRYRGTDSYLAALQ